ncbi:MAG TPA: UvrD-helicase domain-containing protein [Nevskiaceae bacterium]|nr:UvrD-helicase domain-containing protein [Nevskiaceae bacterium]
MNAALDPRQSVVVAASAGTGKTWTLVSRIVRLLLDGAEPGGILALTFTRKAAAEMRARIDQRLAELARLEGAALDAALTSLGLVPTAALRERAAGLQRALLFHPWPPRLMTLHAFSQDLLQRFPVEAGVPLGFEVLEAESAACEAAWQSLLERLRPPASGAETEALQQLARQGLSETRLRALVIDFLAHRGEWWAWCAQQDPALPPLPALAAQLDRQLGLPAAREALAHLQGEAFRARCKILARQAERLGGLRYLKRDRLDALLEAPPADRLAAAREALFKSEGGPYALALTRAHQKQLSETEQAHLEQLHRELVAETEAALEAARSLQLAERTLAGATLGSAALAIYERQLRSSRKLAFADIEWYAGRLLATAGSATWVRYKLDQKIEHLLIDEFQDTSPSQWRLLLPLLEDLASEAPERGRSVFLVGDTKQSIYGFRRAEPALMAEAGEWLQSRLGAVPLQLEASRRSAPAIIDLVNAVFAEPARAEALAFRPHQTTRGSAWGWVELAVQPTLPAAAANDDETLRDPLLQPYAEDSQTRAQLEAQLVARRIEALLASRVAVDDEHGSRALGPGDILVLMRSRAQAGAFERALAERGIPFVGSSRGALLDTVEGQDLIALLRWIEAPHRALELATVLRSPLFGASDEDLLWLQAHGGWRGLRERAPEQLPSAALREAREQLTRWRARADLPVHDLLDALIDEGEIAARYEAALPPARAARVRGNLGALAQLALEADAGRYPSLGRFLFQIEQRRRREADAPDEAPPPGGGGQVRLMTIHAAKGLEAAAVFLVGTVRKEQNQTPAWWVEWPREAAAPTTWLAGVSREERDRHVHALLERQRRRSQREEWNLLYVALTRARHFLHISACAGSHLPLAGSAYEAVQQGFARLGVDLQAAGPWCYGHWGQPAIEAAAAPSAALPPLRLRLPPRSPRAAPLGVHDAAAAREGEAVHRLLQALAEGWPLTEALRDLPGPVPGSEERHRWETEARALFSAPALAGFFAAPALRAAWNELALDEDGRRLVIDRLVDDGEQLWVLDYKRLSSQDAGTAMARYGEQLRRYAARVAMLWPGRRVRAALVFTRSRDWRELPLPPPAPAPGASPAADADS